MAENINLTNIATFQNDTTATTAVNANNATITTALADTLSRSGTAPNQMGANLDMNSNRVLNLPSPVGGTEPLRLQDATNLVGGGTINTVPTGGTRGQVLTKKTDNPYDLQWFSSYTRFNVKAFGAAGDSATDDTAAINSAIAAMNTATAGILYFPSGTYKVTAGLTTITANGAVMGDGMGGLDGVTNAASTVRSTSATATVFTITNDFLKFADLAILCAATPTTAVGITVVRTGRTLHASTVSGQKVDYRNVCVKGFNTNIDIQCGWNWHMDNCTIVSALTYGVRIRNTVNADEGDWAISNCQFISDSGSGSLVRLESSGGGKIVNCKFNSLGVSNGYNIGLDMPSAGGTVDLLVDNCSIENFNSYGVKITGPWNNVTLANLQLFTSIGASACMFITGISILNVINIQMSGSAGAGIQFSACDHVNIDNAQGGTITGIGLLGGGGSVNNALSFRAFDGATNADWISHPTTTGSALKRTYNDLGHYSSMQIVGSAHPQTLLRNKGVFSSDGAVIIATDDTVNNGGADDISLMPGGTDGTTEVLRILSPTHGSQVQFQHANNFSANGAVATVLGSIGPTGSRTTVQKWLTIKDSAGNPFYMPCF